MSVSHVSNRRFLFFFFADPTSSQQPVKSLRERRPTDLPVLDLYSVAREEGEGMETTDTDSVSSANTHIASLEQLLGSSDLKTGKCSGL